MKRNFSIRTSEADIIALDGLTLVAVEVKSIKNKNWEISDISKQVSSIKLLKIKQALCAYASLFNAKFDNMRIDVVALYGGKLYHYKGV